MPDMLREAIFDMLCSRVGESGTLPPFHVADLFAGSGSMGLEALSRGAGYCRFLERGGAATKTLRANILSLGAENASDVLRADAWTACLSTPRPDPSFGLIFVDPPYRDARDPSPMGRVRKLIGHLYRAAWATEDTLIVAHHESRVVYEPETRDCWEVCVHRIYGSAGITIVRKKRVDDDALAGAETGDPGDAL